jgi:hypothetical protein
MKKYLCKSAGYNILRIRSMGRPDGRTDFLAHWCAQARIVYLLLKLNLYNDSRLQMRAQQVQSHPSINRVKMTYFVKNVSSC